MYGESLADYCERRAREIREEALEWRRQQGTVYGSDVLDMKIRMSMAETKAETLEEIAVYERRMGR